MSGVIPAHPAIVDSAVPARVARPGRSETGRRYAATPEPSPAALALRCDDDHRDDADVRDGVCAAFGAIQQIPQIVPGLPEVREMVATQPPPQARLTEQAVAWHGVPRDHRAALPCALALARGGGLSAGAS